MSEHPVPGLSFGRVADAYDRGRPGYPVEAARWLVGEEPCTVLELGAGTGKLTEQLDALGHDVHATDPDAAMLAVLEQRLPHVRTTVAAAERLPVGDRSYDVVVCAQAFHWFDHEAALAEIVRVLKPGGRIAVVWNLRDERIPWVKRFGRLLGSAGQLRDATPAIDASGCFRGVETATFRFWQTIDGDSVRDLALSRSHIATLDAEARAAKLAEVSAFYNEYGRGMYGMEMPYVATCFHAVVAHQPAATIPVSTPSPDPIIDTGSHPPIPDEIFKAPRASTSLDDDTAMLLIDFR